MRPVSRKVSRKPPRVRREEAPGAKGKIGGPAGRL